MRRVIALLLLLLAALAGLPRTANATILPIQGGPGGAYFRADCPVGQYVVGFSVRAGAWIDSIAALCAPYLPAQHKFGPRTVTVPPHGGSGGAPQERYCQAGSIRSIWFGYTRVNNIRDDPQFVDDIDLTCVDPTTKQVSTGCIDTGAHCTDHKFYFNPSECPAGEAATGIHGRSGDSLDALGLICGPEPQTIVLGKARPPTGETGGQPPAPNILKGNGTVLNNGGTVISKMPTLPGAKTSPDQGPCPPGKVLAQDGRCVPPAPSPPPPPPAQPPSYALTCLGGSPMRAQTTSDGFARITFAPATQGSAAAPPHRGECAWSDRGFRAGEPQMLVSNGADGQSLVNAAKRGDSFQVHAYNNNQGAMVVTGVDAIQPARTSGSSPVPKPVPVAGGFAGSWNSQTDNGGIFSITLANVPHGVAGPYVSQNGRLGQIVGRAHGNVLDFLWTQQGGYAGSGQFVLSADGNAFFGSFRITKYQGSKPKKLKGTWQGVRQ